MIGYGAASVIAIAVVVVAILLATGGDDASSGAGNAGNVFPDGGSFPEQTVLEWVRPPMPPAAR